MDPFLKLGISSNMDTMRSASGYGSGLRSTPFTTEKIAVFAPIPRAIVRIETIVKAGDLRSWRNAYW